MSVKGTVRTYHNARGEGKVFSFDLVDSAGGEIKVTAFTDACDKFYDLIQKGKVYMVSKASLKPKRAVSGSLHLQIRVFTGSWALAGNAGSVLKYCSLQAELSLCLAERSLTAAASSVHVLCICGLPWSIGVFHRHSLLALAGARYAAADGMPAA